MTFMNVSSGKEIKCVLFTSSTPMRARRSWR